MRLFKIAILDIVFGAFWSDIYLAVVALQPFVAKVSRRHGRRSAAYYVRLRDQSDDIVNASLGACLKISRRHTGHHRVGSPRADVEEAVRLLGLNRCAGLCRRGRLRSGKPSPAGFLEGARRLGVPRRSVWFSKILRPALRLPDPRYAVRGAQ
jgi:beta-phosphoglucomutase-like phosphatase (HAD superfamily)